MLYEVLVGTWWPGHCCGGRGNDGRGTGSPWGVVSCNKEGKKALGVAEAGKEARHE